MKWVEEIEQQKFILFFRREERRFLKYPWASLLIQEIKCHACLVKLMKKAQKRVKRRNLQRRHWTPRESRDYLSYLQENQAQFQTETTRKESKVFIKLSRKIRSRSPSQVKSHHQKLLLRQGSIENIIACLQEEQKLYGKDQPTDEESGIVASSLPEERSQQAQSYSISSLAQQRLQSSEDRERENYMRNGPSFLNRQGASEYPRILFQTGQDEYIYDPDIFFES